MSTQTTLTMLLAALDEERALLLEMVETLPEDVVMRPRLVGTWSLKELLAHLEGQERLVVQILPQRLSTGSSPGMVARINADSDAWNAQQVAASASLTLAEQKQQLAQARQALLQLVSALGEEGLQQQHPWPEWTGTVADYLLQVIRDHERGHRGTLRVALQTKDTSRSPLG